MIKYAKIINQETGLCEVGLGTNAQFYISIGMKLMDVQQSDIDGKWYIADKCPMKTDEQKEQEEAERVAKLNMTRGDFFEGLILAQGKDEDDVLALIDVLDLTDIEKKVFKSRVKNALDFYRGYPLIDKMCEYLGLSTEQMTQFFETKDYKYLLPMETETDEPTEEV